MSKANGKWSYDWSWTQPYVSMNEFFQGKECREIYEALTVEQELDRIDQTDEMVDKMLTYPDAEAILNKIKEAK
jgi:hypothetical protein